MPDAAHNLLWNRLLAALKARNALPADSGNRTPLEIARYADERLRTNLAIPFVEGYYLERRYGGSTSNLSEAEAEALVAQIESTPQSAALQSAPPADEAASSAARERQAHTSQVIPVVAHNSAVARPEIEESQPIGVEFLPKPKPAPKPAPPPTPPPAPRVEQAAKPAVAAKPKPQTPAKPKKIRRTFGQWLRDTARGCLTNLLFYAVAFLIAAPFMYWSYWKHTSHWKFVTDGDSTYITAMSDIDKSTQKDPARQTLMIGCEGGRDFVRFTFDSPMPSSDKPYIYQGVYLHYGLRVPVQDENPHATTVAWQDSLLLKPTEGVTTATDFQVASVKPEAEAESGSKWEKQRREFAVPEFIAAFRQSDELVLHIEGYLDAQGKHFTYNDTAPDYLEDSQLDMHFGKSGLDSVVPELQQACQWNSSQP
jgi:hypothetical protein